MAIIINKDLPYIGKLMSDGVKIKFKNDDFHKKYIKIGLLNLMPNKEETEIQILRTISRSNKDIWIDFMVTNTYSPKHIDKNYLKKFYISFEKDKIYEYDGMIITGAPLEKIDFEDVLYWDELKEIMDLANKNLKSTLYICWAAQAALYYFYNINKLILDKKIFGVFNHKIIKESPLLKDIEGNFWAPHSRYSYIKNEEILKHESIEILDESEIGPFIIASNNYRNIMFLGHIEYEKQTLENEYKRDLKKGIFVEPPKNYFWGDNPQSYIIGQWDDANEKLFSNWINLLDEDEENDNINLK